MPRPRKFVDTAPDVDALAQRLGVDADSLRSLDPEVLAAIQTALTGLDNAANPALSKMMDWDADNPMGDPLLGKHADDDYGSPGQQPTRKDRMAGSPRACYANRGRVARFSEADERDPWARLAAALKVDDSVIRDLPREIALAMLAKLQAKGVGRGSAVQEMSDARRAELLKGGPVGAQVLRVEKNGRADEPPDSPGVAAPGKAGGAGSAAALADAGDTDAGRDRPGNSPSVYQTGKPATSRMRTYGKTAKFSDQSAAGKRACQLLKLTPLGRQVLARRGQR